jgi:predicted nucleotidyltransferase
MKAREGDLIKTESNVVFDVKGLVHPPNKVIAFPRFIPSTKGTRQGKDALYGKIYNLGDRFRYLQENQPYLIVFDPVFGETLCEVPIEQISEHCEPTEKLVQLRKSKNLRTLETKALQLATTLKEKAGITWDTIGISGSIMAGLTNEKSDIDPLIYGVENCRKAYAALKELLGEEDSGFKPYSRGELQTLFDFRSRDTQMSFDDFVSIESRKAFQGMFMGTDYFVRFVKEWTEVNEQYGDVCYTNSGYAKITANIADSSDALFTPCTYKLKDVTVVEGLKLAPIKEIVSFRGRFCEQIPTNLREPPTVEAQGKVEHVTDNRTGATHYRLIIGNKPTDYMVIRKTPVSSKFLGTCFHRKAPPPSRKIT